MNTITMTSQSHCSHSRLLWLQALCRVSKLPQALQELLLQPKPADEPRVPLLADCGLPSGLRRTLQSQFNASQRAAIASALGGRQQFTLIQVCMHAGLTLPLFGQLRLEKRFCINVREGNWCDFTRFSGCGLKVGHIDKSRSLVGK